MTDVFTAIKAALEFIKQINTVAKSIEINSITCELQQQVLNIQEITLNAQSQILELTQEKSRLTQEVSNLEKEITGLKKWNIDKENYELKKLFGNVYGYVLKQNIESSDASIPFCQRCFEEGYKSVLQRISVINGIQKIKCQRCGTI